MENQTKAPIAPRRFVVMIIVAVVVMSMLYIGLAYMIRTTLPNAFSPTSAMSLVVWRITAR
jgi:hypothetical protein